MSYFNGAKLRQLRESRGLSMEAAKAISGVSVPTISKIETGKADPRMSTVTQLLSVYDASLADLEPRPLATVSLAELINQAEKAGQAIDRSGLGPSDPWARLDRKDAAGIDTRVEREVLAANS